MTLQGPEAVWSCLVWSCLHSIAACRLLHVLMLPALTSALAEWLTAALHSLCSGPELRSVGEACTAPQARNLALCGQLQEVHRSLTTLLPRLPPSAAAALGYAVLPNFLLPSFPPDM